MAETWTRLQFGGLFTSLDETQVPTDRSWLTSNIEIDSGILKARRGYALFGARTSAHANDVGWGCGYGKSTNDEVQRLVIGGSPTGGTVTLNVNVGGSTTVTGTLAYNATSTDVYAAIAAMTNVKPTDISVTGGPWPSVPIDVAWIGQYSGTDVTGITRNTNSLTGGTAPDMTVTELTKGGEAEEYIVAVQHNGDSTVTMYKVSTSGTYTSIATGLTASDWFFQWYGNRIYACNRTDGLHYKVLGGAWDNGGSTKPTPPNFKPTAVQNQTSSRVFFSAALTGGNYSSAWGANPTVAYLAPDIAKITLNASQTSQYVTLDITLAASLDLSYRDVVEVILDSQTTSCQIDPSTITLQFLNNDGSPVTISPKAMSQPASAWADPAAKLFWFGNSGPRASRDNVIKARIGFKIRGSNTNIVYCQMKLGDIYPRGGTQTLSSLYATQGFVKYACSYFRSSDFTESPLSPALQYFVPGDTKMGEYQTISIAGSTELSSSDFVFFYRYEYATGLWRYIGRTANDAAGAQVTCDDKYYDEDLTSLNTYGDFAIPGVTVGVADRVFGLWKQSFVVGFQRQAWISWQGQPLSYAPSPDNPGDLAEWAQLNGDKDDRGVTTYVSDTRSEEVLGAVGEDTLYLTTALSTYAIVGDRPAGSSFPRRLPTSRGALGKRSFTGYGGGILLGAIDGLWHYNVGRGFEGSNNGAFVRKEESEELRSTWETWNGGSASSAVITEWNDEVWCFNGTSYLFRSRFGRWTSGTFADSIKAAVPVRALGFRVMDSKGRLMTISSAYTTDNGTAIPWYYETGWMESDRHHVHRVRMFGSGTPSLRVSVYDGFEASSYVDVQKSASRVGVPVNIKPGFRYKLKASGASASDTIESLSVAVEAVTTGRTN